MAKAAPETSLRPEGRSTYGVTLESSGTITPPGRSEAAQTAAARGQGLSRSLRPELRPRKFRRMALAQERMRARGAVCGDPDIQGDVVGRMTGKTAGCGISNAVRIRSVSGVELSRDSLMDCDTARALKSWLDTTAKPTLARKGGGLKRIRVAAHYVCRTRNGQNGARVSEHGKGRAIDISAVSLRDGTLITVQNGWNAKGTGKLMRQLHRGACGPFGTVLGPDADRFHKDHFHFDTARYRSGPYCR
jgi:hypothetical protein